MLVAEKLCVGYRSKKGTVPVLQNLSLRLSQGEVLSVLGPSGCGKSTLIHTLAGVLPLESGTVWFGDEDRRAPLSPKTQKIAVIPQNCGLLPWKTVRENCLLPLRLRHERVTPQTAEQLAHLCTALEIAPLLHRYPNELSGGQRQRAAVARAFLQKPDLLLMDEPFSALDAITRQDAQKLFLHIWEQDRPTTVFVTHSMEEALYLGTRVAVMASHGGTLNLCAENPFFGQYEPEDASYFSLKHTLRESLQAREGEST